ncbi:hypothetical protein TrCOL_g5176 [Triparma columacea]|uniref:EamA domain-containing protein n=1 Tax=Triparma columacea TaxID=722753 RepID=A0A9W7GMQ0_9STRA|nr:hypothetical protein TrCOL_g5176 [Triparma columacea]
MDAVISGLIGAFSAFLGKVAFDVQSPLQSRLLAFCETISSPESNSFPSSILCERSVLLTRLLGFVVMLAFNGFALKKFVDSMKANGSASGVAVSSGSNYLFASLLGWVFLGERKGAVWFLGLGFILLGSYLLATVQVVKSDRKDEVKEKKKKEKKVK